MSRQLPDIAKLPMFKLLAQNHTMMHGFETVILDYTWKQPAGPMLRQRQWYLYVKGDIYTLTATAPIEAFDSFAARFEEMVRSFKPLTW